MGSEAALVHWSPALGAAVTSTLVRTRHRVAELGLFDDDALVELLERHPRDLLQVYALGESGNTAWPAVDVADAGGATLFGAVRDGRIWLNLIRADEHHPWLGELQARLFDEIDRHLPDLIPSSMGSTVLISSPGTTVPYHLDAEPNLLWQIRGRKRLLLYPAANDAFAPRAAREDLFAGVQREYIPYDPAFDDAALIEELEPGDLIAWPHNGPHRVITLEGLNVSLNTDFATRRSRRRRRVYCANRMLGRRLHLPVRSTAERGMAASCKVGLYLLARALRIERPGRPAPVSAELGLDAAGGGLRRLPAPATAPFS